MTRLGDVPKERMESALQEIRRDVAALQRDLGGAAGNETRWLFLLMWIALSDLLRNTFNLSLLYALGIAAAVVFTYRFLDGTRITRRALRMLKEPLEPVWNTKVEL